MSRVSDYLSDVAANISSTEVAIFGGLVLVMIAGLALPHLMSVRSRKDFTDRDEEFRRLQNL